VLHGSPEGAPLASLLRDVEFRWERTIGEGDLLSGATEQGDVRVADGPGGRPWVYVDTHTGYWNGAGDRVATARATVVRMRVEPDEAVVDREVRPLTADERERIVAANDAEVRTGDRALSDAATAVGAELPPIVRGPFAIGDLVCWNAAIGPAYRPGPLGFKDTRDAPGFVVVNPATGWPLRFTHQHEDPNLTRQRGMPAPFDNGIMRFAWVAPLITNWMGDRGFLSRLQLTIHAPVLYGDTNWYAGTVVERTVDGDAARVRIRVTGTNQLGAVTSSGEAEVRLPVQAG